MKQSTPIMRKNFIDLAKQEGTLSHKGNDFKSGPEIEKYLSVFRSTLGKKDSKYLNSQVGYDWCCAFVYYLLQQVDYAPRAEPLINTDVVWLL